VAAHVRGLQGLGQAKSSCSLVTPLASRRLALLKSAPLGSALIRRPQLRLALNRLREVLIIPAASRSVYGGS
jgi:hypothetical protein